MAHDIIDKLSAEVRAARLGISAFSPHREKQGLPRTGNYTVRDLVLALCDTFFYKSILCHPQMAIRLMGFSECITTGVSQLKGSTTHEVTHSPQQGTLKGAGAFNMLQVYSNSFGNRRIDLVNETHHPGMSHWDPL